MATTIIFYSLAVILTGISFSKNRMKTMKALKKACKSFLKLMPALILMILFVGVLLTLMSPALIGKVLGDESGIAGIIIGAIIGSIAFMPGFVAFSLGANLLEGGAGYAQVGVFIATLMAVGISSLTVELEYFGKKVTIMRNVLALTASLIFAGIITFFML